MQQEIADPNWESAFEFDEPETGDIEAAVSAALRDYGRKAVALISAILDELPDSPEKWGVAFAVGAHCCIGRSMSEVAARMGVTRALISNRAVSFCQRNSLPPSPYMKRG
jgi:hypothetical protein